MTSFIEVIQGPNRKSLIGTVVGTIASISSIVLLTILIINLYSTDGITEKTIIITCIGLGLPAISGLVAALFRIKWLMFTVFIGSLPLGWYLTGTDGPLRLYILVSLCYLLSAILLTMDKN